MLMKIRMSRILPYSLSVLKHSPRKIYETACYLFNDSWKGNPIRHLGIHITDFCNNDFYQFSLLGNFNYDKDKKLNKTIDEIRVKYGSKSVVRSCFLHSGLSPMCGGVGEDDFPMMSSIL